LTEDAIITESVKCDLTLLVFNVETRETYPGFLIKMRSW